MHITSRLSGVQHHLFSPPRRLCQAAWRLKAQRGWVAVVWAQHATHAHRFTKKRINFNSKNILTVQHVNSIRGWSDQCCLADHIWYGAIYSVPGVLFNRMVHLILMCHLRSNEAEKIFIFSESCSYWHPFRKKKYKSNCTIFGDIVLLTDFSAKLGWFSFWVNQAVDHVCGKYITFSRSPDIDKYNCWGCCLNESFLCLWIPLSEQNK